MFSSVNTMLGEERAGLYAAPVFVCLFFTRLFVIFLFLLMSYVVCGL